MRAGEVDRAKPKNRASVTHSEERIWRWYAGLSDYPKSLLKLPDTWDAITLIGRKITMLDPFYLQGDGAFQLPG